MDVREKLVDDIHGKLMGLLQRVPYVKCEDVHRQYAVNWLMNNGVTVQEWISVKDRLPKPGEDALVVVFDGYDTYTDTDCLMRDGKWCYETENHKVTHWQPMPQPPKGE